MVYYSTKTLLFRKTCPLIEKEKCTPLHVVTVETNVRCHLSPKKTDLFIAGNASKITSLSQDKAAADLAETEVLDLVEETTDPAKCSTQNVATVETIVRYHSNQKKTDLFIAKNASKTTNNIRNPVLSNFQNSFIL